MKFDDDKIVKVRGRKPHAIEDPFKRVRRTRKKCTSCRFNYGGWCKVLASNVTPGASVCNYGMAFGG